ncbi:MAG: VWA domain-containing protein, partial [Proteobacteria bacterium]|nr:VWA domain-containing protein [Pseudomonadota bacterium]
MSDANKPPVTSATRPPAERRSDASEVDAFVRQARAIARAGQAGGRLILALDATMSRQPTWDLACELQGQM